VKRRLLSLLLLLAVAGAGAWWWRGWRERRHDAVIRAAARRYGLEPALVKAVVWRESRFAADARGRAGEIGLMQIRAPAAGEWAEAERITPFSHEQLVDPGTNTLAGAWYLRKLLRRYPQTDNPLTYALADYNAGRANVLKWATGPAATNSAAFLAQMTFPGTRHYIAAVSERHVHYRGQDFH